MNDAWVFPLGHLLGPFFPGPQEPLDCHRVRIGADVLQLSTDMAELWSLAHGLPGALVPGSGQRWTSTMVTDIARVRGADTAETTAEDTLAGLLETGALVEVGTAAMDPAAFARGHRLQPLLLGLGVTRERPDLFHIGLLGQPIAAVDELTFDLWQWAPRVANLWELTEVQAKTASLLGDDVDDQLGYLLWRLHTLLANGCGYLDVAEPAVST